MGYNSEIINRDLTFEQFEHLALHIPKRPGESIFSLVLIETYESLQKDDEEDCEVMPQKYPEFKITRSVKGYFSTLEKAETGMRELIEKARKEGYPDIYCFKILQHPLNRVSSEGSGNLNYQNIREYLYGPEGNMLDHTMCSSLDDDVFTEYGSFLGKPRSMVRFKEGDIVEVIGGDTVSLAIVSHNQTDTRWCYDLYLRIRDDDRMRAYMLDYSDDQLAVVDGPEYGNHSHILLCDIMPPRYPISDELKKTYENYLIQSRTPHD